MNINFKIQENEENNLINCIKNSFTENPKKVYLISGTLKEDGFKLFEEEMIDSTAKFYFAVGIDKKHTLRSMLDSMLEYTKDVYVYSNNQIIEFKSNILIFEYTDKAVIYISSSDITESDLKDNLLVYTELVYSLLDEKDKGNYKEFIKNIVQKISKEHFEKITKGKIDELVDSKEIFSTKQYNHSVKSISELLGKQKEEKEEIQEVKIPKVDLSNELDIDFDFDFSDDISEKKEDRVIKEDKKENKKSVDDSVLIDEESIELQTEDDTNLLNDFYSQNEVVEKNNELYDETLENSEFDENNTLDIENLLFSKAQVKLDIDDSKKAIDSDDIVNNYDKTQDNDEVLQVKKVNLNNISNFIMQMSSKPTKVQDLANLKIPNYIRQMIPDFFEFNENTKNVQIDGNNYKIKDIILEIIDAKNNQKYNDREAKLMQKQGQTYFTFTTNKLKEINYDENDIARIIKLSDNVYHIEIISKQLQEYKLWDKICNQKFKSSTRKYGMM